MLIHINKSWDFITAEAKHIFIKTWTSINFMSVLIILIKLEGKSDNTCRAYKALQQRKSTEDIFKCLKAKYLTSLTHNKYYSLAPLTSNRPST